MLLDLGILGHALAACAASIQRSRGKGDAIGIRWIQQVNSMRKLRVIIHNPAELRGAWRRLATMLSKNISIL
jgi:hypothetical protein